MSLENDIQHIKEDIFHSADKDSVEYRKRQNKDKYFRFEFIVGLAGFGGTPEDAWDDALDNFSMDPGSIPDKAIRIKVDPDTYNEIGDGEEIDI